MEYEDFVETVVQYYQKQDWREILSLQKNDSKNAERLTWVWPTVENLEFIDKLSKQYHIACIVSIGCGCGLLEWIISIFTGIPTLGYEVNKEWWDSKYSPPKFITHIYPEMNHLDDIESSCALLFCYFNDREAFEKYLAVYKGTTIILIGPGEGRNAHCDPEPLDPKFNNSDWKLIDYREVAKTKDFIAFYRSDRNKIGN